MSYFLKKTKNKKGTYLQIYESYYDPERKGGAHRSYKPLGYVHELIEKGIDDPVAFYSEEAKKLNQARAADKRQAKARQISETSPGAKNAVINSIRVRRNPTLGSPSSVAVFAPLQSLQ